MSGDLEKVLRFSPFPPEKVQTSNSLVQGAQSGIREAQILLGKCYLKGWSFPVNYSLAYKWLKNPNLEEESSEAVEVLDSHFGTHWFSPFRLLNLFFLFPLVHFSYCIFIFFFFFCPFTKISTVYSSHQQ